MRRAPARAAAGKPCAMRRQCHKYRIRARRLCQPPKRTCGPARAIAGIRVENEAYSPDCRHPAWMMIDTVPNLGCRSPLRARSGPESHQLSRGVRVFCQQRDLSHAEARVSQASRGGQGSQSGARHPAQPILTHAGPAMTGARA
ncbi:hypothetical protein CS8_048900 [Cupriavidus sp. 8B]